MFFAHRPVITAGVALLKRADPGTLTGTVYESDGVTPITVGVDLFVYDFGTQNMVDSTTSDGSGDYSLSLQPGDYGVQACASCRGLAFSDEYWNDTYFWDQAAAVTITSNETTSSIDFSLADEAQITGTVTNAGATPVENIRIQAFLGTCHDYYVAEGFTDASGVYTLTNLPAGDIYLWACPQCDGQGYYLNHYWNNSPGGTLNCDEQLAVATTAGAQTSGIDFTLQEGGKVVGTVTSEVPDPIENVDITVFNGVCWSSSMAFQSTDALGAYEAVVPIGDYYVWAVPYSVTSDMYACEWWTASGGTTACAQAEPVTVLQAQDTTADFVLSQGGTLSGHVFEADGITPIENAEVDIWEHATGYGLFPVWTQADGSFIARGLYAGDFTLNVCTSCSGLYFIDETWDGVDGTWDGSQAVPVTVTAGSDTSGIEFRLDVPGMISGQVLTDEVTPVGIENVRVQVYSEACNGFHFADATTDSSGNYTADWLPPGNVAVYACARCNGLNYVDEWYDDVTACGSATSVSVTSGATTSGIDFSLAEGAIIQGTVTGGGGPAEDIQMLAWGGQCYVDYLGDTYSDSNGDYALAGLPSGDIYVQANPSSSTSYFLREWWDGGQGGLGCQDATPIAVTQGQATSGIDFDLAEGGRITGQVTAVGGIPLDQVSVSSNESMCGSGWWDGGVGTDPSGQYSFVISPGDHYFWANPQYVMTGDYADEWWLASPPGGTTDCTQADAATVVAGQDLTIDFELDEGGTISGTVYETDGVTPIVNVNIQINEVDTGLGFGTNTDSNGSFIARGLHAGSYTVRACASCSGLNYVDEYWTASGGSWQDDPTPLTVTAGQDTPLPIDFTLDAGATISGTVTESDGVTPIANLTLVAALDACSWNQSRSVYSDANGDYALTGLPPTDIYVNACPRCDNLGLYLDEWWDGASGTNDCNDALAFSLSAGQQVTGIDFLLDEGGRIVGTVTSSLDAPLEQVSVSSYGALCWNQGVGGDNTNATGAFSMVVPAGDYFVWADPSSMTSGMYASQWWDGSVDGTTDCASAVAVSVTSGQDATVDFDLVEGATISGVVTEADGVTPIPNLWVRVREHATGYFMSQTQTDATGNYTARGVYPGTFTVDACSSCSGLEFVDEIWNDQGGTYQWNEATPLTLIAGQNLPNIDFQLDLPGSISGTITSQSGPAIEGVQVQFYTNACSWQHWGTVSTDAGGQFTMEGLPPGDIYVYACASCAGLNFLDEWWNDVTDCNNASPVTVSSGQNTPNVDFVLGQGAMISGTVTGAGGPVQDVQVQAYLGSCNGYQQGLGSVQTNASGAYVFAGLPEGDIHLYACPSCQDLGYFLDEWWDNDQGCWNCGDAVGIPVIAGQQVTGIDFDLAEGGRISGVVSSNARAPLSNINVSAYDGLCWADGRGGRHTAVDGSYSFAVPAGDFTVWAQPQGAYGGELADEWWTATGGTGDCSQAETVSVTLTQTTTGIDFDLPEGGTISGYVYETDGITPIANLQLGAVNMATGSWVSSTDTQADGSFTVGGLHADDYALYACASCYGMNFIDAWWTDSGGGFFQSEAMPIAVAAGQDTPVSPFLLQVPGSISGTIETVLGQGIPGVQLQFYDDACNGNFWGNAVTDANGDYAMTNLPAGDIYVFACPGCDGLNYINVWWDGGAGAPDCNNAVAVMVSEGQTTPGVDFTLTEGATISGTATSAGGPAAGVLIQAFQGACHTTYLGGAETDANGDYTLSGLPAGSVYLYACSGCVSQNLFLNEWWDGGDGTTDCNLAAEIAVTAGQNLSGYDFDLPMGGAITGHVASSLGMPIGNVCLEVYGGVCHSQHIINSQNDQAGDYWITLPEGDYYLWANASCNWEENWASEWWDGADGTYNCELATVVSVIAGQQTSDTDFVLEAGGSVSGTVFEADGVTPIADMSINPQIFSTGYTLGGTSTNADGTYTLTGLPPGDYRIQACGRCANPQVYVNLYWNTTGGSVYQDQADPVTVLAGQNTPGIIFHQPTYGPLEASERTALIALYNATDGDYWTTNDNWLGDPGTERNWWGVSMDPYGQHVTSLFLWDNNLNGPLPPEIGAFTQLEELFLGRNNLSGPIPPEIGNLTQLQTLYLQYAELTGNIPSTFGNLTHLVECYLYSNHLDGSIPPEIGNLSGVEYLYLCWNQLSGSIPPELGDLASVNELVLFGNQLTSTIPPELGNLSSVTYIDLDDNQLEGTIPAEIWNLPNLIDFWAGQNQLEGPIPTEVANATNLETLGLYDNQFTGSIPLEVCSLTQLVYLCLQGNNLTGGIPPELGSLTQLQQLYLADNPLGGTIPPEIGNLTNLVHLGLWENELIGTLPPELANLTNLQRLYLFENQLEGTLPTWLGSLPQLERIAIGDNLFDGSIPSELGSLANLQILGLEDNQLTGAIPAALGNLVELTQLRLQGNQLTGTIPPELFDLTNLQILNLSDNQLTDFVAPVAKRALSSLVTCNLSGNQLIDVSGVADLLAIEVLQLQDNQIDDISALVANSGLGAGDTLNLSGNLLTDANCTDLDVLQSRGLAEFIFYQQQHGLPVSCVDELPPEVISVTPNSGSAGGGTSVSIAGNNFFTGATVEFGGEEGEDVVVVSANEITCTTPPHFPAVVDVKVTNTDTFSDTLLAGYTYESDLATVSLPDASGIQSHIVEVPMTIDVEGLVAADIVVTFDAGILDSLSVITTGTLSHGWSMVYNTAVPGQVNISLANPGTPLTGAGTLLNLEFDIIGTPGAITDLLFASCLLNDGAITVQTIDGTFTILIVHDLSGAVTYFSDAAPVADALLTLGGNQVYQATTDASGQYAFINALEANYTLTPSKWDDVRGISSLDASYALQHAVGIITLTGHEAQAADVNKSGAINSMDAVFMLRYVVGLDTLPFPNAGVIWDFDPQFMEYLPLAGNLVNQDFVGVLLGDPTGNWSQEPPDGRSCFVDLVVPDDEADLNGSVVVPMTIDSVTGAFYGVDITLSFDPGIVDLTDVQTPHNATLLYHSPAPGVMNVSMASAFPIDTPGVLLNMDFHMLGLPGELSPICFESINVDEGQCTPTTTDGTITICSQSLEIPMAEDFWVCTDTGTLQMNAVVHCGQVPYTYAWTILSGDGAFDDPEISNPTFTADGIGEVSVQLTVTDSLLQTSVKNIVIHVIHADVDGSGSVNTDDWALMLPAWHHLVPPCDVDNSGGAINLLDLIKVTKCL